jgi:hypothetical protein
VVTTGGMRVGRTLVAALAVALALTTGLALAPARALAAPADVTATHAYIQANAALARTSVARISTGQAKIERLIGDYARKCPAAGAGSPQDENTGFFTYEVGIALWSVAYGTNAGPIRTFSNTVKRLRWSNGAITRAAQRYASSLQALANLALPPLCEDVRSWRASGYRVVPPATVSLVRRVEAIELLPLPQRVLAPYERGSDTSTFAQTLRLEKRLEERESNPGEHDLLKVLDTLTLQE